VGTLAGLTIIGGSALPALASGGLAWRVVHRYAPGGYAAYLSIAASGPHAWAVGSGRSFAADGVPTAAYFNGRRWSLTHLPGKPQFGELEQVSADSPDDAWAIADFVVLHWHEGKWTVARTWKPRDGGPPGPLWTGLTALSPTNVWAFGPTLGTWHLHGRTWTKVAGAGRTIYAASAISANDMWAIGGKANGSLLHYGRGAWHAAPAPGHGTLQFGAILAAAHGRVWVTASPKNGTGFELLKLTNTTWTVYKPPGSLPLNVDTFHVSDAAICQDGHGGFWITANSTLWYSNWLLHFSSRRHWTEVPMHKAKVFDVVLNQGTGALRAAGSIPRTQTQFSRTDAVVWKYKAAR